jgi:hypothetical protein
MTLPPRIRGPRGKAARKSAGFDVPDDDKPMMPPKKVRRSPAHCNFVRDHTCCVPGCQGRPIEVMHVRTGTDGGTGLKPSDRWTIAGCQEHHAEQHRIGEPEFERRYGIDMKELAQAFVKASPRRRLLEEM